MSSPHAHAHRAAPRWPLVVLFTATLLASLTAVVAILYLVGHGRPKDVAAPWADILDTASRTGPALALTALAAVGLCWSVRRLLFERLAYGPGPIHAETFSAEDLAEGDSVDREALCLAFRRRLSELRLAAPTSVPGAVPQSDFLAVLAGGAPDARNVFGSVVALLRAAIPTHAYEIDGALHEGPRGRGVTIQVRRLPNGALSPITVWDTSWDDAVRRAADDATEQLLPTTRLCRGQWSAWRRHTMPVGLLHAYEQGAALEQDRRYDEALQYYYDALRLDPLNAQIRLQVGKLQEKLALYLDAYATYMGIDALAEAHPPRRLFLSRSEVARKRAGLVARYRRVILLGTGEFTDQWQRLRTGPTPTRRDARRTALRHRLHDDINTMLHATAREHEGERIGQTPIPELLDVTRAAPQRKRYLELRELFALAALDEAPRIRRAAAIDLGTEALDQTAVKLTRICLETRLDWVRRQLDRNKSWDPTVPLLTAEIRALPGDRPKSFTSWPENYAAACVYAIPLLADLPDDENAARLAAAAIDHLEQAIAHAASSAYVTTRRDWLVAEDPDLNGLRPRPEFKRFEAMYFPSPGTTPLRPRRVQELESSRHVQALLSTTAQSWQCTWRRRGRELADDPDVYDVLAWFKDETEAWRLVCDIVTDYRDWETRLALVDRMKRWSATGAVRAVAVPSPLYADQPLKPSKPDAAAVEQACVQAVQEATDRLADIARELARAGQRSLVPQIIDDIEQWQARLQNIGVVGEDPGHYFLAQLCDAHAGLWQRLRDWVVAPPSAVDAGQPFVDQLAATRRLWHTAYDWWRPTKVMLALATGTSNGGAPPGRLLLGQLSASVRARRALRGARPPQG